MPNAIIGFSNTMNFLLQQMKIKKTRESANSEQSKKFAKKILDTIDRNEAIIIIFKQTKLFKAINSHIEYGTHQARMPPTFINL